MRRVRPVLTAALLAAVPMAAHAASFEGARWLRLERSQHESVRRNVQVPVLSYQPVPPVLDTDGNVWIHGLSGSVDVLTPYVGTTAEWTVEAGLEAPSVAVTPQLRYAVDRDGTLLRLVRGNPQPQTVATGLPTVVGRPCRTHETFYWPDSHGGVVVTGPNGKILNRFEGEVYRRRRVRGGAAVACADDRAYVAISGGKLAAVQGGQVLWARTVDRLSGVDFADRTVLRNGRWYVCAHRRQCVAVDTERGDVLGMTNFGSYDGVVALAAGGFQIAGADGKLYRLDADLNVRAEAFTTADPSWQLVYQGPGHPELGWVISNEGELFRVDWSRQDGNRSRRVFDVESGVYGGGIVLHDGTAVVMSNFGSLHVLQLQ